MTVMFYSSIFYLIYGILGLFGIQIISEEYKGKAWTKSYIRCCGAMWLGLGVPWLAFYLIAHDMGLKNYVAAAIMLAISLPSFIFAVFFDKKYKAMLKNGQE